MQAGSRLGVQVVFWEQLQAGRGVGMEHVAENINVQRKLGQPKGNPIADYDAPPILRGSMVRKTRQPESFF